jgi:hypothetical protein
LLDTATRKLAEVPREQLVEALAVRRAIDFHVQWHKIRRGRRRDRHIVVELTEVAKLLRIDVRYGGGFGVALRPVSGWGLRL